MRKKIKEVIEIPEGINAEMEGNVMKMKKDNEEIKRKLEYAARIEGKEIIIECEKPTKREKKLIKTDKAHIKNIISGLQKKFVYKLKICSVHFPMNVSVKENNLIIKNFLGEVRERRAKILPGVNLKIENDMIILESSNKEKVGQTAANIENAARIRNKDRRIFQDGIYITEKQKGARR